MYVGDTIHYINRHIRNESLKWRKNAVDVEVTVAASVQHVYPSDLRRDDDEICVPHGNTHDAHNFVLSVFLFVITFDLELVPLALDCSILRLIKMSNKQSQ